MGERLCQGQLPVLAGLPDRPQPAVLRVLDIVVSTRVVCDGPARMTGVA